MRLGWMLVGAVMEQHFPRRRLLLSGIALLGAAMHCLVASAMPSYLVHCCRIWCSAARRGPVGRRRGFLRDGTFSQLCLLWAVVHPIRRHYTSSDRVHRDGSGASRRNGCPVARSGSVDGLLIGLGAYIAVRGLVAQWCYTT